MVRSSTISLCALLAALTAPSAAATCSGADPAITDALVKGMSTSPGLNTYHLSGTVTNLGRSGQPSNTLQFVDIYIDGQKRDSRGIPPLAPGATYTFGYDWQRSSDAGAGSTTARFRIDVRQGSDCNPNNGTYSVTF
jgi:subtilase family serine protease